MIIRLFAHSIRKQSGTAARLLLVKCNEADLIQNKQFYLPNRVKTVSALVAVFLKDIGKPSGSVEPLMPPLFTRGSAQCIVKMCFALPQALSHKVSFFLTKEAASISSRVMVAGTSYLASRRNYQVLITRTGLLNMRVIRLALVPHFYVQ